MISVIIPTYNEERALPETLSDLLKEPGAYEVLVVDGGSTDATRDIVMRKPQVRFVMAPKGRATQMNAGAALASGGCLLFLHADTRLPRGALARLDRMQSDPAVQAGGFEHSFSGNDWRLRVVSYLDNFRCRRSRIMYGDQAMFVRRALFERLGGFPEQRMLEDVAFCQKLVRVATPVLLTPPVITDSRKFIAMGVWRSLARCLLIILHVEFSVPFLPRIFFQDIR